MFVNYTCLMSVISKGGCYKKVMYYLTDNAWPLILIGNKANELLTHYRIALNFHSRIFSWFPWITQKSWKFCHKKFLAAPLSTGLNTSKIMKWWWFRKLAKITKIFNHRNLKLCGSFCHQQLFGALTSTTQNYSAWSWLSFVMLCIK